MKKASIYIFSFVLSAVLFSCSKEYSEENTGDGTGNPLIVGADCRISKMVYIDSTSGAGIGSLTANIDAFDRTTDVTLFDSLGFFLVYNAQPVYKNDTIFINPDEYFLTENTVTRRIIKFRGLTDPSDPASPLHDILYTYNTAGQLTSKSYRLAATPTTVYQTVNYTYTGDNITHMTSQDAITGEMIKDADVTYFSNVIPRRFIYVFPDETVNANLQQFFNFGNRAANGIKTLKVRNYDPGNVLRDSTQSVFSKYVMSRDNYVLSVLMEGDDQLSIPATESLIRFSYKCK